MSGGVGYRRGSDLNENGRNEASDNALESPSAAELVSIKFLVAVDIREGEADVTTGHILICVGRWDTDVVQISMKNYHTKGSDSALESLSLTKLVSIKRSGVRKYLGGGG